MNTKKTVWLLEKHTFERNIDRLKLTIAEQGSQFRICNYIPCGGGLEFEDRFENDQLQPMFAYGSLQMIRRIKESNLAVVSFCNLPQFKCSYYYPRFGSFLLQQNSVFIPYGELRRRKDWILKHMGRQGQVFIRPDDGYKSFAGKLVSEETWDRDIELLGFYDVAPECMCVIAEPQAITAEWRFVVGTEYPLKEYQQCVITGSCYKEENVAVDSATDDVDESVVRYAEDVIQSVTYQPDPFWILDVCQTNSGLHVLETGSMSCADLYGCDLDKVVTAVNSYIEYEWGNMEM